MNLFLLLVYVLALTFGFSFIDKKYNITVRFEDKKNKKFRRAINLAAILSVLAFMLLSIFQNYFKSIGIDSLIYYLKAVAGIPAVFRFCLHSIISEKARLEKEKLKNKPVEVTFCYYCGSELDGTNICPKCGKELEL